MIDVVVKEIEGIKLSILQCSHFLFTPFQIFTTVFTIQSFRVITLCVFILYIKTVISSFVCYGQKNTIRVKLVK